MESIVINNCYGGFSLSHKAIMRYAELKGIKLYPWIDDITKRVYGERAIIDNPEVQWSLNYTTIPEEEYQRLVEEARQKPIGVGRFEESDAAYFSDMSIERTDPILIQVIKELGEEANGACAELKIVSIPNDIEWEIEDYDGLETIAEKHRTWR